MAQLLQAVLPQHQLHRSNWLNCVKHQGWLGQWSQNPYSAQNCSMLRTEPLTRKHRWHSCSRLCCPNINNTEVTDSTVSSTEDGWANKARILIVLRTVQCPEQNWWWGSVVGTAVPTCVNPTLQVVKPRRTWPTHWHVQNLGMLLGGEEYPSYTWAWIRGKAVTYHTLKCQIYYSILCIFVLFLHPPQFSVLYNHLSLSIQKVLNKNNFKCI